MADRTLTINHADGGSETYTINRDKFAGVREMSRGHVYPTIVVGSFTNFTGTTLTKADEQTFTIVSSSTTDNSYINFVNQSNGIRMGKHRIAFDLTLNSGSVSTIIGYYSDRDADPSNGGSYGQYVVTEGSNVIDFEIFDDGVSNTPNLFWVLATGSTFDISVTNFKVTHEPDTVTVDRTAVPKEQSKETTFGGSQSITIKRDIEPLLSKVVGGASAAYSLRDLNDKAGNNKVVRIRRESDNNERDFTAKEVSNGTLQNWTNAQVTPPLDLRELTATGRDGSIIEAAAAYSLRNLSDSYTGSVVDVRRSSDDAVRSFMATEVSDGTLATWVGAGNDGTVSKWYDQSTTAGTPNANHAVQTSAASQPKIVDAGVLVSGGLDFDGVDDFLLAPDGAVGVDSSFILSQSDSSAVQAVAGTNTVFNYYGLIVNATTFRFGQSGSLLDATVTSTSNEFLSTLLQSDGNVYLNGSLSASGTVNVDGDDLTIGARQAGSSAFWSGVITEAIFYPSDQSDNRTAIEANIGEVYGIAGIPAYDDTVNGFVESWYDQSGNGNDATQLTAGSQPKIVDAGSLLVDSAGLPEIDFDGTSHKLDIDLGSNLSQPNSILMVHQSDSVLEADNEFFDRTGVSGQRTLFDTTDDGSGDQRYRMFAQSSLTTINAQLTTSKNLVVGVYDGTNSSLSLNGNTSNFTNTVGADSINSLSTIGFSIGSGNYYDGTMQEFIIYNSDQSANRAAIEANINNQYDIY